MRYSRFFVVVLLFFVASALSAANYSMRLSIEKEQDNYQLKVDNLLKTPVVALRVVYSLAGSQYTNATRVVINGKKIKRFALPFSAEKLQGSFNLTAKLYYLNGNKEMTLLRNRVIHFGKAADIPFDVSVDSMPIHNSGSIAVTLTDSKKLPYIKLILPAEIVVRKKVIRGNRIFYTVHNNAPKLSSRYTIYCLYERVLDENGKKVGQAAALKTRLYAGMRYYRMHRYAGITVVCILLPLLILAGTIFGYRYLRKQGKGRLFLYSGIVLLIAFITYFIFFFHPWAIFWDENYHISAAEKYIQGVMFMAPHPPLGKQFIALGEYLLSPNDHLDKSSFVKVDYIKNVPKGYAFYGVRFFPTLFAAFSALLFFHILFALSKKHLFSLLFSCFYLFENAIILHSRSAMLEGTQLFFILGALLYFVKLLQRSQFGYAAYLKLGMLVGLAVAVKANSLILLLLFPVLFSKQHSARELLNYIVVPVRKLFCSKKNVSLDKEIVQENHVNQPFFSSFFEASLLKVTLSVVGILIPFCLSFYIHFALGTKVVNNRYFEASKTYKRVLREGTVANPLRITLMLRDNYKFMKKYHKGVPKLNTKNPNENGSHPLGWPIGKKSINYRWVKVEKKAKILYLTGNPLLWFAGLFGFFVAAFLMLRILSARMFSKLRMLLALLYEKMTFLHGKFPRLKSAVQRTGSFLSEQIRRFPLVCHIGARLFKGGMEPHIFRAMGAFLLLYVGYMVAVLRIDRVMYLYHYLMPLIFSFVLAYLNYLHIFTKSTPVVAKRLRTGAIIFASLAVLLFLFYAPLTYYWPLSKGAFELRNWFSFWGLKFV